MELENANCKLRVSECTEIDQMTMERPLKIDREITGLEKLVEELHRMFSTDHVNVQDVQKVMAGYRSNPKDWKKYAKFDRFRYTRNLVDAGNGAFNIMIICWGPGHASAIHDHADSHCFMKLLSGSLEEVRYDWPETHEPEIRKNHKNINRVHRCCIESDDFDCNGNCQKRTYQNGNGGTELGENGGTELRENGGTEIGGTEIGENGGDEISLDLNGMEEIGRTRLELNDVCYINDALGLHRMENPSYIDGAVSLHLYSPPFSSCRVFDARTGTPTKVNVTFTSMYGKKVKRVIEADNVADSQQ